MGEENVLFIIRQPFLGGVAIFHPVPSYKLSLIMHKCVSTIISC